MEVPQKPKRELPCDSAIRLLRIHTKASTPTFHRNACTSVFCGDAHNSQVMDQPRDDDMKHTQDRILSSYKEEQNDLCRKMNAAGNHHIAWNKSDSDKHVFSHLCNLECTWQIVQEYMMWTQKWDWAMMATSKQGMKKMEAGRVNIAHFSYYLYESIFI